MGWRNSIFLKKRGNRSTGAPWIGHWSELLVSLSLVVIGGAALAFHVHQVLWPQWQARQAVQGYVAGTCKIIETRVRHRTSALSGTEYGLNICAARVGDEGLLPPVWIEPTSVDYSPSHQDISWLARRFEPGTHHPCWYDPQDPARLVLHRGYHWWPWPVALIPASLLAVGIWGIVASLMQVATSTERWNLVRAKAARLDPLRESPTQSATLPAVESDIDSPGIYLAHRLPHADSWAWRMAGLFVVCAIWNALLAYFGYVAARQFSQGNPSWLALSVVVLLGMIGVWLAFHLVAELWNRRRIGQTHIEVSQHPLELGGQYRTYLLQTGHMELVTLSVALICEEVANYQQGTNSQTTVEQVSHRELRKWRRLRVEPGSPFEAEFDVHLPATAMHSFRSLHNQVRWLLEVRALTGRKQNLCRRWPLHVCPVPRPVEQEDAAESAHPSAPPPTKQQLAEGEAAP